MLLDALGRQLRLTSSCELRETARKRDSVSEESEESEAVRRVEERARNGQKEHTEQEDTGGGEDGGGSGGLGDAGGRERKVIEHALSTRMSAERARLNRAGGRRQPQSAPVGTVGQRAGGRNSKFNTIFLSITKGLFLYFQYNKQILGVATGAIGTYCRLPWLPSKPFRFIIGWCIDARVIRKRSRSEIFAPCGFCYLTLFL